MADLRGNIAQGAGPLDQLNDPGEVFRSTGQVEFIRLLVRMLKSGFARVLSRDQAAPYFHLSSPSGKAYKITVSDDGALSAEYIRG